VQSGQRQLELGGKLTSQGRTCLACPC
jgi:hypothetical protein